MKPEDFRASTQRPFTGEEYLKSLQDGREIYIYGERVKDVTTHPAFRNAAASVAQLYDALHKPEMQDSLCWNTDTGSGGYTHKFFRVAKSADDLRQQRDAIAEWSRLSYGWMGRTPDYKAAFGCALGANPGFYGQFEQNARNWYTRIQETGLYFNHAIVNPPIDRHLPTDKVKDVYIKLEKETDAGIIVSGAKVVATNSALTHYNMIGFGSPYDYPLSSRFDENDAILVMDNVLIPWENVLIYRDFDRCRRWTMEGGFARMYPLQACVRLAVKLDFITALLKKSLECTGTLEFRGVQADLGEVVAWRNTFWALSDSMCSEATPWVNGAYLPDHAALQTYRVLAPMAYAKIKNIIERNVTSGLIYLPSSARDLNNPQLDQYLAKYVRGSNGMDHVQRIKILKLMWDAIGSEFGGRHELYEINYSGSQDEIRLQCLRQAQSSGNMDKMMAMVDRCLSEYDQNGWTVPHLHNNDDINMLDKLLK
ncbi:Pyoverdin chromophore biosynthetic protein pvcC [Escherichia coli]|nr:Pyoverdin chromophore biosynthetic protein pvcC [Escherichia coli]EFI9578906.1 Pyoverdin chromophore biosynthetic protein pvcC [Escherichia coli]